MWILGLKGLRNPCRIIYLLRRVVLKAFRQTIVRLWVFRIIPMRILPACRRLLFPLLHAEKGRLRNAVANRVPASRWQGILFRINCEILSG